MVQTKTEITRNIKKYKIGDMNPCDLTHKIITLREAVVDSFRTYDTYDFCDNLYKYVIYQECSEFLGVERIFGFYKPFSVEEFSSLLDQDNKVWEFRAILNIHVKNLLLLGEIDSFYNKLLRSKMLGNIKERNYFKKMCISHYTYSEIQELIYNYETVFMDLTTKYKHAPLPFMTDNNTSWINKLSNRCVIDTVVPEDPEIKWKLKNVFMGEEVDYTYIDPYDELPSILRPEKLYEEPLNLNGVLKMPKNKEEKEMAKKKSISYAYDYIPDYEETYLGIKFTYGLNRDCTYDVTIEIDSIDDIKIIDNKIFNDETLREVGDIPHGVFKIDKHSASSWILKKSREIFYADKELQVVYNNQYYPDHMIIIRYVGNTDDETNSTYYTDDMLKQIRSKYRKVLKKRDALNDYIAKERWLHENSMYKDTADMTEEQLVEYCKLKSSTEASRYGINFRYLTTDMIVEMCHKYIEAIINKITEYNIELYK